MQSIRGSDLNQNSIRPKVFRRYEDGYVVREMTLADARIVQNWYCGMGIISPYDLNVPLSVFPPGQGFYIGEKDGIVIASAIRIPWGGGVFYGSYYYVAEQYRRAGYGTRLRDEVAREYVGENILCVDAVEGKVAANNKSKYGYEYAFKTGRFEGVAQGSYGADFKDGAIVKVSDVSFDDIIDYDNKCFVRPKNPVRRAFLEKWLSVPGGASFAALDRTGRVVGYGQRRPCFQEKNHLIGPLYADDETTARALLQALCAGVSGENVTINIWMPNKGALEMVQEFKMTKVFTCDRMHINGDPKEYKDTTFALTSIDVCGF